jgi:hypothetical protein
LNTANFPEFHLVYVEEENLDVFLETGSFPKGTDSRAKADIPRWITDRTFGKGYFNGELNGIDASVKDSKRFARTNG